MDLNLLIRGIILGFSIAAPVGPIGVLCIRRTITSGFPSGLLTGLGAATADAFYGAVAAFGLTFVSGLLTGGQFWLRLLGGLFLLYLGVSIFVSMPPDKLPSPSTRVLAGDFVSTFFLTLANPATIISFAALFAGFGMGTGSNSTDATLLVVGVFIGSVMWWLLLSVGISVFRSRFSPRGLRLVNMISGSTVMLFGLLALGSLML